MKAKEKFTMHILFGLLVFIAALMFCISLPLVSYAETGSLGTESPEIYCTYEQDGVAVDGNNLTAGTYDVNFVLSGAKDLSVIEITAEYDEEQVTIEPTARNLISDDDSAAFDSMGYILSGGDIVFGFVSTNEDCSPIDKEEQIIATVQMTFASDCDAEEYITVSGNPNFTFAQADYGDGYDDEYALVDSMDGYNGVLYLMNCDVTPAFGNSVSGNLVIMTDAEGSTNGEPVYGECLINVYSDAEKTNLVASVTSSSSVNENNKTVNTFNIEALTDGTYYAAISAPYALVRDDIVIHMNGDDISAVQIPLIVCDFNNDKVITGVDAGVVYAQAVGAKGAYCDLNGDGVITGVDAGIVYSCAGIRGYSGFIIE